MTNEHTTEATLNAWQAQLAQVRQRRLARGGGHAVFQATPQLKHYNPLGSVHGGWYATLLDPTT